MIRYDSYTQMCQSPAELIAVDFTTWLTGHWGLTHRNGKPFSTNEDFMRWDPSIFNGSTVTDCNHPFLMAIPSDFRLHDLEKLVLQFRKKNLPFFSVKVSESSSTAQQNTKAPAPPCHPPVRRCIATTVLPAHWIVAMTQGVRGFIIGVQ